MSNKTMKRTLDVSVHDIVDLILRTGDLDSRIFNRSTMQEGSKMHLQYQREHAQPGYQAEVDLHSSWTKGDLTFAISGRADGLYEAEDGLHIEEIKTTVAPLETFHAQHEPWHLGQALFYAWMYLKSHAFTTIHIDLYYAHQTNKDTLRKTYMFTPEEVEHDVSRVLDEFYEFYQPLLQHQDDLKEAVKDLQFPFKNFRHGQRELAKYVYGVAQQGGRLFVEAPTGIGKTISTLFPFVKQLGNHLEKVFYFTAKNSGKQAAVEACERLQIQIPHLRYLVITAKDQASFCPRGKINPDDCLYARGYYDRIKDALHDALNHASSFTLETIHFYAEKHQVEPFEFSLDLSLFVDVVIADYNYLFDPSAYLRRFFEAHPERYAVLVDEAHNLVERSRDMYSSVFTDAMMHELKKMHKGTFSKPLKQAIQKLEKQWMILLKEATLPCVIPSPKTWLNRLNDFLLLAQAEMKAMQASFPETMMDAYFKCLRFSRMVELYDDHYVYTMTQDGEHPTLTLLCLDSSHHLRRISQQLKGAVFFSATLSPLSYYLPMLGAESTDPVLQLPSPFRPENFRIMIASRVQTTLKKRLDTIHEVTLYLEQFITGKLGNYLFFFPSYQYLEAVKAAFHTPDHTEVLGQHQGMSFEERDAFLQKFTHQPQKTTIGFAVLGGVFSEGIDLVADRLIGVAIVSVGLPGLSFHRDLMVKYFDDQARHGFQFAYGYPAMNKVLQALGRVIRSEEDRGVALLLDARYLHPDYQPIFQRYPTYDVILSPDECLDTVHAFFAQDKQ